MTATHTYITTTIPYVNARPHLGFALELVQADVLARHRRARGDQVRLQAGTDDNSLKNVLAARAAGVGVQEFVDANADAFVALAAPLSLSVDDIIRTSRDPRHRPGVEALWRACADAGDLYRRPYEGLYCVGCEQFYTPGELPGGRCPEHGTEPQRISEENWFFRLSRYAGQLRELITSGTLRIEPAERRHEVLAQIAAGLEDFSVSRSAERAHGWGIPVPGDPSQVIYVWWDALGNYVTALRYGTGGADLQRWWTGAQRRIHLAGKGVVRFHAVYWPAILLSAGLPLPTDILVHDYLTAGGQKISKSGGVTVDPTALTRQYGTDAVRWWLLREVPRLGDTDFTEARLVGRANDELANGLGNLVSRVRRPGSSWPPPGRRQWPPTPGPVRWKRRSGARPAPWTRRWPTSTSGPPPGPFGGSSTRPTATSARLSPGSRPGWSEPGTGRPAAAWTPSWPRSSGRAARSPACSRPSCPMPPPGSPSSAPPRTGSSRPPCPSSSGWPSRRRHVRPRSGNGHGRMRSPHRGLPRFGDPAAAGRGPGRPAAARGPPAGQLAAAPGPPAPAHVGTDWGPESVRQRPPP
jgi:methionyl-tRNA synthetase